MRKIMGGSAALGAVLAAFALGGCSGPAEDSPVGRWGAAEAPGATHLEFAEDGSYSGSDGCNRVMGRWESVGELFTVAPMATTMMACEDVDVWLIDPASVRVNGESLAVLNAGGIELGRLDRTAVDR